ncbi:MAG: nitrogen-fixing NifU protein [Sphingomonadales bacterium]|nr:nitrogen-fixing NifU protein [Sphingomonadales bacterium]
MLRSGKPMKATVEGQKVAIFAVGDDVVATNGRCPHAHGPLHNGEVEGTTLTCPWHGWTFDLRSGVCDEDPELVLERYDVVVEGDDILVRI